MQLIKGNKNIKNCRTWNLVCKILMILFSLVSLVALCVWISSDSLSLSLREKRANTEFFLVRIFLYLDTFNAVFYFHYFDSFDFFWKKFCIFLLMNKNIWKEWKEHLRENIKQKLKKPQRQNKICKWLNELTLCILMSEYIIQTIADVVSFSTTSIK